MNRRKFLQGLAALPAVRYTARMTQNLTHTQVRYRIPPTLHHVSETTATLFFQLAQAPTSGEVVATSASGDVRVPLMTGFNRQYLTLSGLSPSTSYTLSINADGAVPLAPDPADTWPTLTFSTLPYEGPLRIVALGDSGFGDNTTPELAALMAAHQPHLFLHLGDVVYRMYENDYNAYLNWWLKYFRPFAPVLSQAPHALTFGNHDGERAAYLDGEPSYELMYPLPDAPPGQRWHSFMMANIRFICLDSQVYFSYPSLIEPQEQWLEQTLAQDQGKYTIVFFHVPPFNSSDLHYDATDVIAQRIVPRLESANVPLTLSAHAHIYERVIHNGLTYIVAGAGGASIYGEGIRHPESQVMVSRASYPYIECHDDHIRLTAYDIAGDVIDDVRIEVG